MAKLASLAHAISSKNAGNFHLTFDIVFNEAATYQRVRDSGVLTRELFSSLFSISTDDVVKMVWFPQGLAFKASVVRAMASGGVGETDVYGAQQYAPLLDIEIPDTSVA